MKQAEQRKTSTNTTRLETFTDLLSIVTKSDANLIEINHLSESWENIPLIVPKTAFILEKRLLNIQTWRKSADDHIAFLLSGEAWSSLKDQFEIQKNKEHEFENNTEEYIRKINELLTVTKAADDARVAQEKRYYVEPYYYDQFFVNKDMRTEVKKQNSLVDLPDENVSRELEEPRKYSLKHLQSIVYALLEENSLSKRVSKIENKVFSLENKIAEQINEKFDEINKNQARIHDRITLVEKELRAENERKSNDAMDLILKEVKTKIGENMRLIVSNSSDISELMDRAEEHKSFKRRVDEKFSKIAEQNTALAEALDNKMQLFDQNLKALNTLAEKNLETFRENIEKNFSAVKQESDRRLLEMKVENTIR